jgi:hypothetical protein
MPSEGELTCAQQIVPRWGGRSGRDPGGVASEDKKEQPRPLAVSERIRRAWGQERPGRKIKTPGLPAGSFAPPFRFRATCCYLPDKNSNGLDG